MKAIIVTPTGSVINMRTSPLPTATIVAELESGDVVDAMATQGEWTHVNWQGEDGWVDSNYVVLESETVGELNGRLRKKLKKMLKTAINPVKATKAALKTTKKVVKATANPIKATKNAFNIKKTVKDAIKTAKISTGTNGVDELDGVVDTLKSAFNKVKSLVSPTTSASDGGAASTATSSYTKGQTLYVSTQTDPLVMHQTAAKSGTKLTSIPRGAAVTVADSTLIKESGYNWIKVNYGSYSGYVASDYLSVTKPTTSATSATNVPDLLPTTDKQQPMTLTDNAKKYIKWGVIGAGVLVAGYFGYKAFAGGGKKKGRKGLNGIKKQPLKLN